ncbi:hypothetical protein Vadar_028204 [Vaccinium darrowii]|uniref:Uncharacterized protein n=1 Tax=Vaccinium darrowii TaxID=229202 RepID=A0ACB7YQQ6_9ERIC|nr:hypothetical protein Vadar_028204 [Vaccinium darrowii]
MASRPIVQQQNRGGDQAVGKQKNMAAAPGGRNRRALGDIGNLVTARGIDAKQITRPVTRSFCAQLLANAQAAAAAENNKKLVPVNVEGAAVIVIDGGGKGANAAPVPKMAQKKVTVKPIPQTVIEISPDTEEDIKIKKPVVNSKKAGDGSSKKKAQPTLTAILTARSKAACGLNDKTKEKILDIDAADIDNELAVVEYVEDMYKFYKLVENESRVHDYMDSQQEINERMRAILVDWLIEVHHKFELMPETLYLTFNIVDRYLASKSVSRRELQLVGLSAMLMASKYEEIWAPEVNDFVCIADRAYTHSQVLVMEKRILGQLEWNLTVPTPYVFLVRFIKASLSDQLMENMVYFLAELGMMNYETIIYCPSMLAASAVYAARCTLNKSPVWNDTLRLHTGFSEAQVMDCAKLLVSFHKTAAENTLKVIYRKYSNPERGAVARLPPAKTLLATSPSAHRDQADKQKTMAAAPGGRNRRALGDIGNLVTARRIDAKQITRPVTRSFCAQLLTNAQAAAAAENNKKLVPVNVEGGAVIVFDGGGKGANAAPVPKMAQKKVTVKPIPQTVIEISPDTEEDTKNKKPVVNDKKAGDGSSRKKAQPPTLTAILTARSKAVCGLNNKPKEKILDIDAADIDNELAVVEYVEDMYKFYKLVENESRVHYYMDSQPEINERMRAILVDWLIEVHHKFELMPETLYLTFNIVDRYLASKSVSRRELQLVGLSAMLMASKYEEIWAPEVNDFVCISDRAYTHSQVLVMEKRILGQLEWNLTVPTPYVFLVLFIKASLSDQLVCVFLSTIHMASFDARAKIGCFVFVWMENMVYFLAELGMMNYKTIIYCPSMLAASAVYAARCTLNKSPVWNDTLKLHTGFSEAQVMDCAKLLVSFHKTAAENTPIAIYRKYSNPERGAVALLPPAKTLLANSPTAHS